MTKTERKLAGEMLRLAADEFGNHGCNDMELENTDENWAMIIAMHDYNGSPPEDRDERPKGKKKIFTQDYFLMGYLSSLLTKEE